MTYCMNYNVRREGLKRHSLQVFHWSYCKYSEHGAEPKSLSITMSHKAHEGYSAKNPVPKVALKSILNNRAATESKAKALNKDAHQDDNSPVADGILKGATVQVKVITCISEPSHILNVPLRIQLQAKRP